MVYLLIAVLASLPVVHCAATFASPGWDGDFHRFFGNSEFWYAQRRETGEKRRGKVGRDCEMGQVFVNAPTRSQTLARCFWLI